MTRATGIVLLWTALASAAKNDETVRYLRLLPGGKTGPECTFTLTKGDQASKIVSVTGRGAMKMTVTARHDGDKRLLSAEAALASGGEAKSVRVTVKYGKAIVKRDGLPEQEFDVPPGVIVTSAPDWSDTFLLCRGYDAKAGGKQEFAGLWIHPEQPARRLTFSIERQGFDIIEHESKRLELARHLIRIRNNSEYAAWTDASGRMIKLTALPVKESGGTELVCDGFQKSAAALKPPGR